MMKGSKRLRFFTLAFILIASTLVACQSSFQAGRGKPSIDEVIMAHSLDGSQKPVDQTSVFASENVFYASVKVSSLKVSSKVTGKWFFGDQFIDETGWLIQEDGFSGYIGFNLAPSVAWPPGDYRLEVYLAEPVLYGHLEDKLAQTTTFRVEE
ncbi:MAG: hypothetical protein ACE5II_03035 [Anaerolineae bacterium]